MASTVQESINKIRESFRIIKSTAESANVKFQEEGKPFIEIRDDKLNGNSNLKRLIDPACRFFSDTTARYSDESVIDNLIIDAKTEKDKALRDYNVYKLSEYAKIDEASVSVLENKTASRYGDNINGSPDESAIKTANDQVRLLTSDAYKRFKNFKSDQNVCQQPPKKPVDYSLSRQEKERRIKESFSNKHMSHSFKSLQKIQEQGYKKVKIIRFADPSCSADWGIRVGRVVGIVIASLLIIATLFVVIRTLIFEGIEALATFATNELPLVGGIILSILLIAVSVAIGTVISYYACSFLCIPICFIGILIYDFFSALIWPFSAIICKFINSKREKAFSQYYHAKKEQLHQEFNKKLNEHVKQELDNWEKCNRDYDAAQKKYEEISKSIENSKEEITESYYREIARIAATSKPILTTTLKDIEVIKKHVEIIKKERTNLYVCLNVKYDYEGALECYNLIANGDVETYDQAIAMYKNLSDASKDRERRYAEQLRKEAEERSRQLAQERLERERAWEREQERKREERIKEKEKEKERQAEERIKRLENAIRDAESAQREQTNAILKAAISSIKTMNEQNDLIEENNKLLDKIDKGY